MSSKKQVSHCPSPQTEVTIDAAMKELRSVLPRDVGITISTYWYLRFREVVISASFELARGRQLTDAMVKKAITTWQKEYPA